MFKLHGSLDPKTFYMLVGLIEAGRIVPDQIKATLYKSEYLRYEAERSGALNG